MAAQRRYGLILPDNKAQKKTLKQVSSVFADDEDDLVCSPEVKHDRTFSSYSKKNQIKRQVELEMEKALSEDPTVYEYDNIYEGMHSKKVEVKNNLAERSDNKPKYIGNLLKAAENRKKEMERRMERKIHKEREAEKGKFDDRDAFVTESYRQKIEQMRKDEELEKLNEEREAKMDVTKQQDLTGFYCHLLKQAAGEDHEHVNPSSRDIVPGINQMLGKAESVSNPQSREEKPLQRKPICFEDREMEVDRRKVVKASHDVEERCSVNNGQMEKADRRHDGRKRSRDRPMGSAARSRDTVTYEEDFRVVADKKLVLQSSEDRQITPKRVFRTSGAQKGICSETLKGGSERCLESADETNVLHQHPNTVRRTTASSLDDARARFMARKSMLKVPVNVEDSG